MKFEYFLFVNDTNYARQAIQAGMDTLLVDWEYMGKPCRQRGYDTEINLADSVDLREIASIPGASVWCRINQYGSHSHAEIEKAIEAGACGLLLPMVHSPQEVEAFLRRVDGRCETAILLETVDGYNAACDISKLPFGRVYFGLNDYAICRGNSSIFQALLDGDVERMRDVFADKLFGFGGVTKIGHGSPIPVTCLLQEMIRLNCDFSFMRRSFRRDTSAGEMRAVVADIDNYIERCRVRSEEEVKRDRERLIEVLHATCP